MNTQEMLQDYQAAMAKANKNSKLKEQYLQLIINKDLDLATRWDIYLNAPDKFKNKEPYICHFVVLDKKINGFSWYDDLYLDKNETITGESIIEGLEDLMADYEPNPESLEENAEDALYEENEPVGQQFANNPELLDELKEEILAKNMGSFTYDW